MQSFSGKIKMAIIIKVSGTNENINPSNGKVFTLEELQQAVGGYIELVPINQGEHKNKLMIVDEEGKLKADAQVNREASEIAGQQIVGQI
ncbi:MAG: DUF3846 domain-containing protein, partial [Planctomycetes bacterium]|nr:DUF3846 domain-containing protein [Planctomycetota bacterium]